MKKLFLFLLIGLVFAAISVNAANAQIRSLSLNGATGLISTPTAHTGWEKSDFGADIGFSYLDSNSHKTDTHDTIILKATVQFLKNFEAGIAYDWQEGRGGYNNEDILIHGKWRFHQDGSTAVALGGNLQFLQSPWRGAWRDDESWNAQQIYVVATYQAPFFKMPSETSMTIGKSFGSRHHPRYGSSRYGRRDIDFSMGFAVNVLPDILGGLQWICEFANYSYSADPVNVHVDRGIFNTGARLAILNDSNFRLNADLIFTDLLDNNRNWGFRLSGGAAF